MAFLRLSGIIINVMFTRNLLLMEDCWNGLRVARGLGG